MRRKFLCGVAWLLWAQCLRAQSVPARDLWEFPLGAVLEPAALAIEPGSGLWNPASIRLNKLQRWRVGVVSLQPASDQGVDGRLVAVSLRRSDGVTLGFSIAQSSVVSLVRTETDPQALGAVPYSSMLVSTSAAHDLLPHVTVGAAIRYRSGRADRFSDHALAADLGLIVHSLPIRDARVALSSFLWRPGREIDDRPAFVAAGDARFMGEAGRETRLGYSYNAVTRGAREHGPFLAWRYDRVDLRGALLRTDASGRSVFRLRSGIALHYARYVVGVAREEGTTGLGPLYQFTLSSLLR